MTEKANSWRDSGEMNKLSRLMFLTYFPVKKDLFSSRIHSYLSGITRYDVEQGNSFTRIVLSQVEKSFNWLRRLDSHHNDDWCIQQIQELSYGSRSSKQNQHQPCLSLRVYSFTSQCSGSHRPVVDVDITMHIRIYRVVVASVLL